MRPLFEIDTQLEALLNASVDRETGEVLPDALAEIEALEMERDAKALHIGAYIVDLDEEAEKVRRGMKRLAERAARHERHAERLREYLASHLPQGHRCRDERVEIGWRKSSAVEVEDEDKLPYALLRIRTEPDKTAIKEALQRGEDVKGAHLVERMRLQIR